jgi:hypothetical protein
MILALAAGDCDAASELAQDLADLRATTGRKVLLVSHQHAPARDDLHHGYEDIVFDLSAAPPTDGDLVLKAAGVILVLVDPAELAAPCMAQLAARIRQGLAANPGAEVLVALRGPRAAWTPHEVGCVLVFVAQIAPARLVDTLMLDCDGGTYRPCHGSNEGLRHLYRQVFN